MWARNTKTYQTKIIVHILNNARAAKGLMLQTLGIKIPPLKTGEAMNLLNNPSKKGNL